MSQKERINNLTDLGEDNRVETTTTFTGNVEQAVTFTQYGTKKQSYNQYEIVYQAGDKECRSWYSFYPAPEPDVSALQGTTMRIRYNKGKPSLFEQIED